MMRLRLALLLLALLGCGRSLTEPLATQHIADIDGRLRTFRTYIPGSSTPGPMPIVFVLHGLGASGLDIEIGSGFDEVAAKQRFMVVYPDADAATRGEWAIGCERCTGADTLGINDIGFLDSLLAMYVRDGVADPKRAYVTGFSLGSYFTNVIACQRADVYAAAITVAGQMTDRMAAVCPVASPIPMLVVGSKDDPAMPWNGGVYPKLTIYSADSTARFWATRNRCAFPATSGASVRGAASQSYGSCANDAEVRLWAFDGIGHRWPNATEEMAAFLFAHHR